MVSHVTLSDFIRAGRGAAQLDTERSDFDGPLFPTRLFSARPAQSGNRLVRNHLSRRLAHQFSVHHAPDAKGILIFQFVGQSDVWKILIADGTGEAKDRQGADGSGARIGAGRVRTAMNDGIAEFQAGGVTVVNNSADFIFEDRDEFGEFDDVLLGAVNGGGEMAVQSASGFEDLFFL